MSIPFIDLQAQYRALKPSIDQRIQKVLDHGQFILGPEVKECENALSQFVGGNTQALTCSSGTDAQILALMALGIGRGDEVITTAFSFFATAETIILCGATPVFVDIDPVTFNIDPAKIEEAITPKTRAIVPVGLYGQTADMGRITEIAAHHKLHVIEDAAQSFGASFEGRRSCGITETAFTSFFPAKPLGCYGDGGAVFSKDPHILKRMEMIRNHGQESRYYHTLVGINGRMDTLQCAILLAKLERFGWELESRQKWADRYNRAFRDLNSYGVIPPKIMAGRTSAWAQYTLRVPKRDELQKKLQAKNIPTTVHYPRTMPDQPAFKNVGRAHDISHSRRAAEEVLSLPMHPEFNENTQDQIIAAVVEAAKQ